MNKPLHTVLMILLLLSGSLARAEVRFTGVNLAGAEFGSHTLPGEFGRHYTYPDKATIDYFVNKGMNIIRLPFRWERLQREVNGPLHEPELNRLDATVQHATAAGAYVILDPHNYARYHGTIIGTGTVTNQHFGDFWARLARLYRDNDRVFFNLVNEPHGMPTEHWVETANVAIVAIRAAGAKNLILVPGNAFSGAHSWNSGWYGTPNGKAMLKIVDPADNYALEVHQYVDRDSSGRSDEIVSPEIGARRLNEFTQWAKQHNKRGFLGEFAVANSRFAPGDIGAETLTNMLDHMDQNADVWLGWTWWAAGPWWGEYLFSIQPIRLGQSDQQDRPAMRALETRLAGARDRAAPP